MNENEKKLPEKDFPKNDNPEKDALLKINDILKSGGGFSPHIIIGKIQDIVANVIK